MNIIKRLSLILMLSALMCGASWAQPSRSSQLSSAQIAVLRAAILAETDPVFVALRTAGATGAMADWYNQDSVPAFVVWKTSVPIAQVGIAFNSAELAGLTTANTSRLQVMAGYSAGFFNPSQADVRAGFDTVFAGAGGLNTRTALAVLWKRTALRGERLYATGTGTTVTPGLLVYEGLITNSEIVAAIN